MMSSFFFNDPPTTETYTLSLPDALPISAFDRLALPGPLRGARDQRAHLVHHRLVRGLTGLPPIARRVGKRALTADRKSTRLNSSHANISYAVFCFKKKK